MEREKKESGSKRGATNLYASEVGSSSRQDSRQRQGRHPGSCDNIHLRFAEASVAGIKVTHCSRAVASSVLPARMRSQSTRTTESHQHCDNHNHIFIHLFIPQHYKYSNHHGS